MLWNGGVKPILISIMKNLLTNHFGRIKDIDLALPETWTQQIFLTFDIDWVCDAVLEDTISILEEAGVAATWFVTHQTPLLDRLRSNPNFELGLHPNFNNLLNGQNVKEKLNSAEQIIDELLTIVPEAKSIRSHSMTQSSRLYDLFAEKGLTHECNTYIPSSSKITLCPWKTWQGLIKISHFWEDDLNVLDVHVDATVLAQEALGLKVFDFHPIHLYLNTETLSRYEDSRAVHLDPCRLLAWRSQSTLGARSQLNNLLCWSAHVRKNGI
jgi:hypothetical protein